MSTSLGVPRSQLYGNFFENEASMDFNEEAGSDFPPDALALMYDPPIDDDLDNASDDSSSNHVASASIGSKSSKKNGPSGPILSLAAMPAPYVSVAGNSKTSSFGPHLTKPPAVGPSGGYLEETSEGIAFPPRPNASSKPKQHAPGLEHLTNFSSADSFPEKGERFQTKVYSQSLRPTTQPSKVLDQPRTFSRSVQDAKSLTTSEAGAASIAAIMQVVAKAGEVPVQQRPNSDKWSERLNTYSPEKLR